MVDHVTDTYEFTVKVIQHGSLEITNVTYPSEIEPSAQFTVQYTVTNNGGTDEVYGLIKDKATNSEIANTRWQGTVSSGTSINKVATLTGRATDLNATIEVGYYTE